MSSIKKTTILSIDGGGIRGIMPGVVLAHIETRLRKLEGDKVRLVDYFDILCGSSTGGILSLIYNVPNSAGRPKYTAQQAVDLYMKNGGAIFSRSAWQRVKSVDGVADEKYSAKAIEQALERYFENIALSQLLKPCLITSYDIEKRKSVFFNSVSARQTVARDYQVRDVARATSAAPTFFETAAIESATGEMAYLIDGGLIANNPTMCAYSEARALKFSAILNDPAKQDYPTAKDMLILSLGTGEEKEAYDFDKAKDWGIVGWLRPLIDIMMSGNAETVDYELRQIFDSANPEDYVRFQPPLKDANPDMDDASDNNLQKLHNAGKDFIIANHTKIEAIIAKLIANKARTAYVESPLI